MKKYFGKYRGIVKDNKDPLKLGRVKCIVPDIAGDIILSWAVSGNSLFQGVWMLPSNGDQVWIEFEKGEMNLPIYSSIWYNSNNIDQEFLSSYPKNLVIKGKSGTTIRIDDSTGDMTIENTTGNKVDFKSDGNISMQNLSGSSITISPVGEISITATTLMNITSTGVVNITGSLVNLG